MIVNIHDGPWQCMSCLELYTRRPGHCEKCDHASFVQRRLICAWGDDLSLKNQQPPEPAAKPSPCSEASAAARLEDRRAMLFASILQALIAHEGIAYQKSDIDNLIGCTEGILAAVWGRGPFGDG